MNASPVVSAPAALRKAPQARAGSVTGHIAEFWRDPLGFYTRMHAQYGDLVSIRFGPSQVLLLFKPEYVKRVLQDNNKNYVREPSVNDVLKLFAQDNLFTADGEFWLHQRRIVQPVFHRQRIAEFGEIMRSATQDMLTRWERAGGPVMIDQEMNALTLRIIGRALVSEDLSAEASALGHAYHEGNLFINHRLRQLVRPPMWLPTRWNRRGRASIETVVNRIDAMIASRRASGHKPDLLSLLMQTRDADTGEAMPDIQVRREVQIFLAAGHETTASTLTWALYLLSQHPDAERTLHAEVDRVLNGRAPGLEDADRLVYTRQIIDETLRLYPAAWALARRALQADQFGPYASRPIKGSACRCTPFTAARRCGRMRTASNRSASRPRPRRRSPSLRICPLAAARACALG